MISAVRLLRAIVIAGLLAAVSSLADIVTQGSKLPWKATVPSGWVGGTAQQIEKMLAIKHSSAADESLDKILRSMLPEAKGLDALFYHTDVRGNETKTISSLRINVTGMDLASYSDKTKRTAFWNAYAKEMAKDYPEGATIELTDDRSGMTGGRKAYRGTFAAALAGGGKVYTALHLIAYAPDKTHMFRLHADGTKFRDRVAELDKIVESLKYGPE